MRNITQEYFLEGQIPQAVGIMGSFASMLVQATLELRRGTREMKGSLLSAQNPRKMMPTIMDCSLPCHGLMWGQMWGCAELPVFRQTTQWPWVAEHRLCHLLGTHT